MLLTSYVDDVALAALDCFYALAIPPFAHRSIEYSRHITALHKSSSLCHYIFEVIDASNFLSKISAEEIVELASKKKMALSNEKDEEEKEVEDEKEDREDIASHDLTFQLSPELTTLHFDLMNRLLTRTSPPPSPPLSSSSSAPLSGTAPEEGSGGPIGGMAAGGGVHQAVFTGALCPDQPILTFDLLRDHRSIPAIISQLNLSPRYRHSLQWHIRLRRFLLSPNPEDAFKILRVQFASAAILLCTHPSSLSIAHFFQDKAEFFHAFHFCLKTGPGAFYLPMVPLELRLMSNQCLCAIIGSRDTSASILSRFNWLQHDLGLNRSQYLGLLPCLLRYITATFLDKMGAANRYHNNAGNEMISSEVEEEEDIFFTWSESVLTLIVSVLNVPNFLSALIDNGLISLLLSMLKSPPTYKLHKNRVNFLALIAQIIDMAINNHAHGLTVFKDALGLDIITDFLHGPLMTYLPGQQNDLKDGDVAMAEEVEIEDGEGGSGSNLSAEGGRRIKKRKSGEMEGGAKLRRSKRRRSVPTKKNSPLSEEEEEEEEEVNGRNTPEMVTMERLTPTVNNLLHGLISILSSCLHEGYSDGADNRIVLMLRSKNLTSVFYNLCLWLPTLCPAVAAAVFSMLGEAISNDPSPPSVLSLMMTNDVVQAALLALNNPETVFSGDSLLAATNLLSGLSLTQESIHLIRQSNPFPYLIGLLTQNRYVLPRSKVFMTDLATLLGNNLEELVRHHPAHTEMVMAALVDELNHVAQMAENFTGETLEENEAAYLSFLHFSTSLLFCLEPLLSRRQSSSAFASFNGISSLLKLARVFLGPPRFLLSSLASSVGNHAISLTANLAATFGLHPAAKLCVKCLHRIAEFEPRRYREKLTTALETNKDDLYKALLGYWVIVESPSMTSSSSSSTHYGDESEKTTTKKEGVKRGRPRKSSPPPPLVEVSTVIRLTGLLESVPLEQLRECFAQTVLSPQLVAYAEVLKSLVALAFTVDVITALFAVSITTKPFPLDEFTNHRWVTLLNTLIHEVYLPGQAEVSDQTDDECSRERAARDSTSSMEPLYRILVVAPDHVVVRSSTEESGKKVYKLERGKVVDAFERIHVNGMTRYRVEGGWISHLRTSSSMTSSSVSNNDPQVQVIEILPVVASPSSISVLEEGYVVDKPESTVSVDRLESVMTCRTAGRVAMTHFHASLKRLLGTLMKTTTSTIGGQSFSILSTLN